MNNPWMQEINATGVWARSHNEIAVEGAACMQSTLKVALKSVDLGETGAHLSENRRRF